MSETIEEICGHQLRNDYKIRDGGHSQYQGFFIRMSSDNLPNDLNDIQSLIFSYIKLIAKENGVKLREKDIRYEI